MTLASLYKQVIAMTLLSSHLTSQKKPQKIKQKTKLKKKIEKYLFPRVTAIFSLKHRIHVIKAQM